MRKDNKKYIENRWKVKKKEVRGKAIILKKRVMRCNEKEMGM